MPDVTAFIVQAGLVLRNFFLHDFALKWLENVHLFLHLCDNFQFNVIWHRQSVGTLVFCPRLAESDVTFMPSVMCMDGFTLVI
jgi:hypothetical protein